MIQTFKKSERLSHVKVIESLFDRTNKLKQSFAVYPLRVIYQMRTEGNVDAPKVLFSVPKRSFKKAVDRNLLKRRMNESYRLNKSLLGTKSPANIIFLYTAKHALDYRVIEAAMLNIFNGIKIKLN